MTVVAPWLYTSEGLREKFYSIQYNIGEAVRITGIFAQPFMPIKAKEMLDILGVHDTRRDFRYALWGADRHYGRRRVQGAGPVHLFPRLTEEGQETNEPMPVVMNRRRAEKLAARKEQGLKQRADRGNNGREESSMGQGGVY